MHFPSHEQKQALLEPVLRLAGQRLSGDAEREARDFIALYYHHVDAEDLASREPEDLYGAAMAQLAFARQFVTGMPKLRVYNPRREEHGWSSPHTVIEMVNDDMPFLVDSVTMEVNRQGYTLHLLNHPIFAAKRDKEGNLVAYASPSKDEPSESLIHVEIDREIDPVRLKAIGSGINAVLADVRGAVEDWPAMRDRLQAIVKEMDTSPPPIDKGEVDEIRAFLEWTADQHFTFLGYREYELIQGDG